MYKREMAIKRENREKSNKVKKQVKTLGDKYVFRQKVTKSR
jgi:hypothetical protein